jgi:hypothetical protein
VKITALKAIIKEALFNSPSALVVKRRRFESHRDRLSKQLDEFLSSCFSFISLPDNLSA